MTLLLSATTLPTISPSVSMPLHRHQSVLLYWVCQLDPLPFRRTRFRACQLYSATALMRRCIGSHQARSRREALVCAHPVILAPSDSWYRFKNVITFNMDEYVGLPRDHSESYHTYVQRSIGPLFHSQLCSFMFREFFSHSMRSAKRPYFR
jgi:hypothetical protein